MYHRRRRGLLFAVLILQTAIIDDAAAADINRAQELRREAAEHHAEGDFEAYTTRMAQALAANPASRATRYDLACGYALTGRPEAAMSLLEGLAAERIDFGAAGDEDFASLRGRTDFRALLGRLQTVLRPRGASRAVGGLERPDIIPEGIAADSRTGRLYFGSMRTGEIFLREEDGGVSRFAQLVHDGAPLSAIGLTVDATRGLLWAVGSRLALTEGYEPGASDSAGGAFGFDLATGQLSRRYVIGASGAFNDIALAPDGTLYLTGARLMRVGPDEPALRPVPLERTLHYTNGIVVAPDGRSLIVSSYPAGLARVDLETGSWRYLSEANDWPLVGIDGLYWYQGDLIAIQNGLAPWRILRLRLNTEQTAVADVRIIEFANPAVTATTGAIVDSTLFFVGTEPPPDEAPPGFPAELRPFLGATRIMRSTLD